MIDFSRQKWYPYGMNTICDIYDDLTGGKIPRARHVAELPMA
jgi:hypothetical protein